MKLVTKKLMASIPPAYATEETDDPIAVVKFFSIVSDWRWYVLEGASIHAGCTGFGCEPGAHGPLTGWSEGEDALFFGLVEGHAAELGFWTLRELQSVKGPGGIPGVERDIHWKPRPISEIRRDIGATWDC